MREIRPGPNQHVTTSTMMALTTTQGTAATETALCAQCFHDDTARERVSASAYSDVEATADFTDCSQNGALECVQCGAVANPGAGQFPTL